MRRPPGRWSTDSHVNASPRLLEPGYRRACAARRQDRPVWPIEFADLVNAEAPIARGGRPKEKAYEKVQPFTLDQWKGLLCENTDIVESEYRA